MFSHERHVRRAAFELRGSGGTGPERCRARAFVVGQECVVEIVDQRGDDDFIDRFQRDGVNGGTDRPAVE
jgi:hypothetical protein